MYRYRSSCKLAAILVRYEWKLNIFLDRFSEKHSNIRLHENIFSGSRIVPRGWTDRQTYRQTYRERDRQIDRQTERESDRQTERERETDRQRDRPTDRQTNTKLRISCLSFPNKPKMIHILAQIKNSELYGLTQR
jgi:hypothetical protein